MISSPVSSGIAVLSLSNGSLPAYSSITPLPTDADTTVGSTRSSRTAPTPTSTGSTGSGRVLRHEGCRVPLGESLQTSDWTYWNGSQWVSGESNAGAHSFRRPTHRRRCTSRWIRIRRSVRFRGASTRDRRSPSPMPARPRDLGAAPQSVYSIPQISRVPERDRLHPHVPSGNQRSGRPRGLVRHQQLGQQRGRLPGRP